MWYRLDIGKLAEQLLPPVLRSSILLALLRVLVAPLETVIAQFRAYRQDTNDAQHICGHVLPLETALNRAYQRQRAPYISIESVHATSNIILYHESEGQVPLYLSKETEEGAPTYMVHESEAPPDINFVVHVPTILCTSLQSAEQDTYGWVWLTKIRDILDRYKPAGRHYVIELYNSLTPIGS